MDCSNLINTIDSLNDTYCRLWEKVCNIESPTNNKAGVDAVGKVFTELAAEHGWKVDILENKNAGNAICITLNPNSQEQAVVFSGHIDTVHPIGSFGCPAVKKDSNKIYGPGVMDCKGGVIASFMALDTLEKCGYIFRPVKLIIQTDEETSSKTSSMQTINFMLNMSKNAIAFLNTEGMEGTDVVIERKGILRFRFTVYGKAIHSSECMNGANAICEAAHKIIKLETMKDEQGLTCNCGVITGGTAPNTVAGRCEFLADIRFANKEQYNVALALCEAIASSSEVEGCSCELERISYRPAMPLTLANVNLLNRINDIYKSAGIPILTARASLGGSDATYTTEAGIPTIDSIGVCGDKIHSLNEFAYIDSLKNAAKRLAIAAYFI